VGTSHGPSDPGHSNESGNIADDLLEGSGLRFPDIGQGQYEGNPFVLLVDGHAMKDPDSPCVHYLYKKGANREVSPDMLAQVGKTEVSPRS
jgi:hypothetical protein